MRVAWNGLAALAIAASAASGQVQLEFAPVAGTYTKLLPLPNGDRLFVGTPTVGSHIALSAFGTAPFGPLPPMGGHGNDVPYDAAVDLSGNVWIVGTTDSDDFRVVNAISAQKAPYEMAGFVIELDSTGTKLLFSTYLGGQHLLPSGYPDLACFTRATAIAADGSGNVYVGGSSDAPAAGTSSCLDNFGEVFASAYVWKISPAGKLLYSASLGGAAFPCFGGSACIGKESTSGTVDNIVIDSGGTAYAAGTQGPSGYVTKVSQTIGSGDTLPAGAGYSFVGPVLAALRGGGLDVFGIYRPAVSIGGLGPVLTGTPGLFTEHFAPGATTRSYSIDFGQAPDSNAAGLLVDASGNAWLAGTSSSPTFPAVAGSPNLGKDFLLRLDGSGNATRLFRFPAGTVAAAPSLDANGRLAIPGPNAALLSIPVAYAFDSPAIVGFSNAASYQMDTGIYPGTLVSLFGYDLSAPSSVVQLTVNGVAAPVLYAGADQINIQVPFETQPGTADVKVVLPSGALEFQTPRSFSVGIFTTDGLYAAALNQDGTVNSAANPASPGTVVTLFGTGGTWPLGIKDNTVANAANPLFDGWGVTDSTGNELPVLYAGTAPGLLYGVFQLNVLLLPNEVPQTLTLQTPSAASNPVRVYVK